MEDLLKKRLNRYVYGRRDISRRPSFVKIQARQGREIWALTGVWEGGPRALLRRGYQARILLHMMAFFFLYRTVWPWYDHLYDVV